MTETIQIIIENLSGIAISLVSPFGFLDPNMVVEEYGSYCGAGKGFGDIVVPDTMWGLNVSPACAIHDEMWDKAPATWEAFHYSNSVFMSNLISLITSQSKSGILKRLRLYRAVTYYNVVDSLGAAVFWELKHKQMGDVV